MPTVTLIRGQDGKLVGMTERDVKGYAKFKKRAADIGESCLIFTWKEPRSTVFHRRHFSMIGALYESQEMFVDRDAFRKWLEIGAGYCDWFPGKDNVMVPIPKSIDYASLDQSEFEEIHTAVFSFVWSEYARSKMWPHLNNQKSYEMVESILMGYEK